jgi:predicted permease
VKKTNLDETRYVFEEKTISALKANAGVLLLLPLAAVCFVIYGAFHAERDSFNSTIFIACAVAIILLHELTHGVVWGLFCEEKWKSIKFGFIVKALTPYCHCKEALTVSQYKLGGIAPLFVAGILPFIVSVIIGNDSLMYASLLSIVASGGDMLVLIMLSKEKGNPYVKDHDSLVGYVVYRAKE